MRTEERQLSDHNSMMNASMNFEWRNEGFSCQVQQVDLQDTPGRELSRDVQKQTWSGKKREVESLLRTGIPRFLPRPPTCERCII